MVPKWYEYAQKQLDKNEYIQKTFEGKLDGNYGHLYITDHRLLFVKQEGFLRKSYEIILDLLKDNIKKIKQASSYELYVVDTSDREYIFAFKLDVSIIEQNIKEVLMVN